ncbi:MAG TPA: DUF222 domain-containing protein [Sinomonas sp.]|nr:DUF222 domain-containing protein [Sinomonas sp.]
MTAGFFVDGDDAWVPALSFKDPIGSTMLGTISVPVASSLTADGALRTANAADRLIAWATAAKLRALARVEEAMGEEPRERREGQPARLGGDEAHALAVAEVATAGAVSEHTAARLLNDAADLAGEQWAVLEALEWGDISPAHARVIIDTARTVPAEHAGAFSRIALQRARTRTGRRRTPAELRTCLRKLREQLHPEALETRKKTAQRERGVWFAPEPDGMCTLTAHLPAEAGLAIYTGLDRAARTAKAHANEPDDSTQTTKPGHSADTSAPAARAAEERTLSQLRADALIHHLLDGPSAQDASPAAPDGGPEAAPSLATFGQLRPEVVITIPLELALGAETNEGTDDATIAKASATAELEGYGPIDAATARRLASLAPNWFRLFTDAVTGKALGVGRTAYRPPQALRRYLAHRDGGCIFPTCTHPSTGCEPDHTIEWQDGGTTDPDNLALLCRKHHALKSIGAWSYTHTTTGELTWRSPVGRIHTTEPTDRAKPLFPLPPPRESDWPREPEEIQADPPGSVVRDKPPPF